MSNIGEHLEQGFKGFFFWARPTVARSRMQLPQTFEFSRAFSSYVLDVFGVSHWAVQGQDNPGSSARGRPDLAP